MSQCSRCGPTAREAQSFQIREAQYRLHRPGFRQHSQTCKASVKSNQQPLRTHCDNHHCLQRPRAAPKRQGRPRPRLRPRRLQRERLHLAVVERPRPRVRPRQLQSEMLSPAVLAVVAAVAKATIAIQIDILLDTALADQEDLGRSKIRVALHVSHCDALTTNKLAVVHIWVP